MTPPIRIFWNQKYPQFTFMDLKGLNPLGAPMTHGPQVLVDPMNFGAVYDVVDISPDQAAANFTAIQAAIASLPDAGGALFISGYLFYTGTILNPRRIFPPQTTPRSIPFVLVGGPGAALVQLAAGAAAIELDNFGDSYQVGSRSAPVVLQDLQIYSKGKGVVVRNGGKETQLFNVRISGCSDTGLDIQYFDGGRIRDVYCIGNAADGCHIDQAHMDDIVITCRTNGGIGLKVTNSEAHKLWVYSESNVGLGMVLDQFKYNDITLWLENNNGSSYNVQSRVTNSPFNLFRGSAEHEANRGWDMDDLSACTSRMNDNPIRSLWAKEIPALTWPPVQANIHGPFGMPAAITPVSTIASYEVMISVPPSYYTLQTADVTKNWIELYSEGWYPPLQQTFVAGDTVYVTMSFKADSAMAAFFAAYPTVDTVKVQLLGATGCLGSAGQSVNLRNTDEFHVQIFAPVVKSGADTIRVFLYVCPEVLGTAAAPLPTAVQVLTVTDMQFHLLKGLT